VPREHRAGTRRGRQAAVRAGPSRADNRQFRRHQEAAAATAPIQAAYRTEQELGAACRTRAYWPAQREHASSSSATMLVNAASVLVDSRSARRLSIVEIAPPYRRARPLWAIEPCRRDAHSYRVLIALSPCARHGPEVLEIQRRTDRSTIVRAAEHRTTAS